MRITAECSDPNCEFCHPKETDVYPDNRSYAECFRVLRGAKKDRIIKGWSYNNRENAFPAIILSYQDKLLSTKSFADEDGTKGDIGVLNEAVEWVVARKKQVCLPAPNTMTAEECMKEIFGNDHDFLTDKFDNGIPTFSLVFGDRHFTGIALQTNETMTDFLRRCVERIREAKSA